MQEVLGDVVTILSLDHCKEDGEEGVEEEGEVCVGHTLDEVLVDAASVAVHGEQDMLKRGMVRN